MSSMTKRVPVSLVQHMIDPSWVGRLVWGPYNLVTRVPVQDGAGGVEIDERPTTQWVDGVGTLRTVDEDRAGFQTWAAVMDCPEGYGIAMGDGGPDDARWLIEITDDEDRNRLVGEGEVDVDEHGDPVTPPMNAGQALMCIVAFLDGAMSSLDDNVRATWRAWVDGGGFVPVEVEAAYEAKQEALTGVRDYVAMILGRTEIGD